MSNPKRKSARRKARSAPPLGSADDLELKESVAVALSEAFGQCLSYQRGEIKKNQAPPWANEWLKSRGINPPNDQAQ